MIIAGSSLVCLVGMVCAMALYIVVKYWDERRSVTYSVLMTLSYIGALVTLTVTTSTLDNVGVLIAALVSATSGLVGILSLFKAFVLKSLSRRHPTPPDTTPQDTSGVPPVRLVSKRDRPVQHMSNLRGLGHTKVG